MFYDDNRPNEAIEDAATEWLEKASSREVAFELGSEGKQRASHGREKPAAGLL
jgi:hypothetical protein